MASPQTIQPATSDTYVDQTNSSTNYNTNTTLIVGRLSSTRSYRDFIGFDFSSLNIPAGSTITSAVLSMYLWIHNVSAESTNIVVSHLLRYDSVSSQITWTVYKTGSNWSSGGAGSDGNDYTSTDAAIYTQPNPIINAWNTWDVTDQIQHSLDSHSGVWLARISGDESADTTRVYYYSSDYVTDTSLCPKLYIEWTEPTGIKTQINIGDIWKNATSMQINISDSWRPVTHAQINVGDSWKSIF